MKPIAPDSNPTVGAALRSIGMLGLNDPLLKAAVGLGSRVLASDGSLKIAVEALESQTALLASGRASDHLKHLQGITLGPTAQELARRANANLLRHDAAVASDWMRVGDELAKVQRDQVVIQTTLSSLASEHFKSWQDGLMKSALGNFHSGAIQSVLARTISLAAEGQVSRALQDSLGQTVRDALAYLDRDQFGMDGEAWREFQASTAAQTDEVLRSIQARASQEPIDDPDLSDTDSVADVLRAIHSTLIELLAAMSQAGPDSKQLTIKLFVWNLIFTATCTVAQILLPPIWDTRYRAQEAEEAARAAKNDREAIREIKAQVAALAAPPFYGANRRVAIRPIRAHLNPRSKSPISGNVRRGQLLIVIKAEGDWTQVEFQDEQVQKIGWVFTRYLQKL